MSTRMTIRPLTRFWLALERLPGLAAVEPQWRWLIQDDFDLIRRLLTPDPDLTTTFPRLGPPGEPYRVIEHGPDDIVGVGEEGEEPLRLSRAALIVHRLDPRRLAREVATVFGIDPDCGPVEGLANTHRVGLYRPTAGFEFPAFLTIQLEEREYRTVLESLVARTSGKFLLLAPTTRHHRLTSKNLLRDRTAALLPLADTIRLGEGGRWERTEHADKLLAEFRLWVLPSSERPALAFFATPASARWADVRIRFTDGHTVEVKVGVVTQTLSYSQLGMSDRRSTKPTVQWELLRQFARDRGILTWGSSGASGKNQKRCENLAKALKAFFRIDGDPIVLTPDRKGWQTVFTVEPD
jgi:hypothetical protein